jgi:hypothetical protein
MRFPKFLHFIFPSFGTYATWAKDHKKLIGKLTEKKYKLVYVEFHKSISEQFLGEGNLLKSAFFRSFTGSRFSFLKIPFNSWTATQHTLFITGAGTTLMKGERKNVSGGCQKIGVEGGKGKEFLAKACQKEVQGWLAPPAADNRSRPVKRVGSGNNAQGGRPQSIAM